MNSLLDALDAHATNCPDALCVRWESGRAPARELTWAQVREQAGRAAGFWAEHGVGRGDVVVLVGTHHLDFYACWLGALWVGAVPTVLAEPSVRIDREVYFSRLAALVERIDARALALDPSIELGAAWPPARLRASYSQVAAATSAVPPRVSPRPDEVMVLQHSSGTTGLQKGVMLSHGAVLRHAEAYAASAGLRSSDIVATWLPLYHDMGFIACFVTPLILGASVIWLSPFEWVANPGLLLTSIGRARATHVWLPNFAFAFLATRVRAARGAFDLSSLHAVVNCSEPVTAEAMEAFSKRFAADGLRPGVLQACYAMAENVFAVTTSSGARGPTRRRVLRTTWVERHVAQAAPGNASDEQTVLQVSSGRPIATCQVKIVDEGGTRVLAPTHAGRVLIRSPFLFGGYFRRDELDGSLFDAEGFYDTGDLGYLDEEGELFVTGRLKDLVIVGGRNLYPHDVEQLALEVEGVRPGRVVCFGVEVVGLGTEGLVMLLESDLPTESWRELERRMRGLVPSRLDVDLLDVKVVERGTLRKSTSGKLARGGNREWYLQGRFGTLPTAVKPA